MNYLKIVRIIYIITLLIEITKSLIFSDIIKITSFIYFLTNNK